MARTGKCRGVAGWVVALAILAIGSGATADAAGAATAYVSSDGTMYVEGGAENNDLRVYDCSTGTAIHVSFCAWDQNNVQLFPGSYCTYGPAPRAGFLPTVMCPATNVVAIYGHEGNDRVTVDVNAINDGGTSHNQTVYAGIYENGGPGVDELWGGVLTDVLDGGPENDTLRGRPGSDTLNGESGNDFLDDLGEDGQTADVMNGGPDDDTVHGGPGPDVIRGDEGADTLRDFGNDQAQDSYDGGPDSDYLLSGSGPDSLYGGSGGSDDFDTVDYSPRAAAVAVSVGSGGANDGTSNEGDDVGADVEAVIGGSGNDTLTGGPYGSNLNGSTGDDTFISGSGPDEFNGDGGQDTVTYEFRNGPHTVSIGDGPNDGAAGSCYGGAYENDDVTDTIERVRGSAGCDLLRGDGRGNTINGLQGQDHVVGGGGGDDLHGGAAADVVEGGAGNDTIHGGEGGSNERNLLFGDGDNDTIYSDEGPDDIVGDAGVDTVSYEQHSAGVTVSPGSPPTEHRNDGSSGEADEIDNTTEVVEGSPRQDSFIPGPGATTFRGHEGDDTFQPDPDTHDGGDTFNGGDGDDWAAYSWIKRDVRLSIGDGANDGAQGLAADDITDSVEDLDGGAGNDILTGDEQPNSISGGGGRDVISGLGAKDTLDGEGQLWAALFSNTQAGNDDVYGGAGNDIIRGWDGNDLLEGGADNDTIDGGEDADTLRGGADNDVLSDMSGSAADTLQGEGGTDTLNSRDSSCRLNRQGEVECVGVPDDDDCGGQSKDKVIADTMDRVANCRHQDLASADGDSPSGPGGGTAKPVVATASASAKSVSVTASPGVANQIKVRYEQATARYSITEYQGKLQASAGCIQGASVHTVSCLANALTIDTGDGDDIVRLEANVTPTVTVRAGSGQDVIVGGDGPSTLDGGPDNDTIDGGKGTDTIISGPGVDTVSYQRSTEAVKVDTLTAGGDGGPGDKNGDDVSADTEVVLGSKGPNTLKGTDAGEILVGGPANDTIEGRGGGDWVLGSGGSDVLNGGTGTDLVAGDGGEGTSGADTTSYEGRNAGVNVTLDGVNNDGETGENDVIGSDVEAIAGGNGNDTLVGNAATNLISGGSGNDTLRGGDGVDWIVGGAHTDLLDGGKGGDAIAGGDGVDTDTYAGRSNPVRVDLDGQADDGEAGENDLILGDVEGVTGGNGNDTIIGDTGSNPLDGGPGRDTVDYSDRRSDVGITLDGAKNDGGSGEQDDLSGFEVLIGGAGQDLLVGDGGDQEMIGNDGNDIFRGGAGADAFRGGGGDDIGSYADHTAAVNVTLDGVANDGSSGEGDQVDTEYVEGGSGNDTISGTAAPNTLIGGAGNDTIEGLPGNDALVGGPGNDTLRGGDGNDSFDGGAASDGADVMQGDAGADAVTYWQRDAAISVSLDDIANDGAAGEGDNARSDIESVSGGKGNDSLTGNAFNNQLFAREGNDSVTGGAGNDYLLGEAGNDTLDGGDDSDIVAGGSGTNVVNGGAGADSLFAEAGSNQLNGEAGNDSLYADGDGSADVFADGATNIDFLNGGDGDDALYGGAGGDDLVGGGGGDLIYGRDGSDNIGADYGPVGSDGADRIEAGAGNDAVYAGGGNDYVIGEAGTDWLYGDSGTDRMLGGAGNDEINAGDGDDNVDGDDGDDALQGDRGTDAVNGGPGNDRVEDFWDGSVLKGDAGDDTLRAAGTSATLDGGPGADEMTGATTQRTSVDYSSRSAPVSVDLDGAADDGEAGERDNVYLVSDVIGGDGNDRLALSYYAVDPAGFRSGLHGRGGNDLLVGNDMPNLIDGDAGDDTLDGLARNDILNGGLGNDSVDYSSRTTSVVATIDGNPNDGADANGDGVSEENDLIGADVENLLGGNGADKLTGSAGPNQLTGGPGADQLFGLAGADFLNGQDGAGTDKLSCGTESDVYRSDPGDQIAAAGTDICETRQQ